MSDTLPLFRIDFTLEFQAVDYPFGTNAAGIEFKLTDLSGNPVASPSLQVGEPFGGSFTNLPEGNYILSAQTKDVNNNPVGAQLSETIQTPTPTPQLTATTESAPTQVELPLPTDEPAPTVDTSTQVESVKIPKAFNVTVSQIS